MEIILLQDVKALGKKGEVVKVNDGYARNFILPKRLGVEANSKNMNDLKLQKANEEKVAAERLAEARALADELKDKEIVLNLKLGDGGKTFGSVSSKEIAEAAKTQLGYNIDKKNFHLKVCINSLGVHNVGLKLHPKVTAELKVKVQEQN